MRHPQIQFFDFNGALETYVCQFADRTDPRVTARFTAMTLAELKIAAVTYLEWMHTKTPAFRKEHHEQLERIDDLCNRIAKKEQESIDGLENMLSRMAADYRATAAGERAGLVELYHQAYAKLKAIPSWHGEPDADSQLAPEDMPKTAA